MNQNGSGIVQKHPVVFDFVVGDVTGDEIPDKIYLTGRKTPNSPYVVDITLMIKDGRTGLRTSIPLVENAGYNPTLYLEDFTGNGVKNILVSIASGGSGGIMFYYIFSLVQNIPRILFDFNVYNEQYQYRVTYLDDYKVQVISEYDNIEYSIDISSRGADYLNEIYEESGKLITPIEGFVDPLGGLYPVDYDANKIYSLLAIQKISGRYHADTLGFVQNVLKWDKNKFVLDNQFVAIIGNE